MCRYNVLAGTLVSLNLENMPGFKALFLSKIVPSISCGMEDRERESIAFFSASVHASRSKILAFELTGERPPVRTLIWDICSGGEDTCLSMAPSSLRK